MQLTEIADGASAIPLAADQRLWRPSLLAEEVGLHVSSPTRTKGATRVAARVRLAVAPLGDLPADKLRTALRPSPRSAAARRRPPLSRRTLAAGAQHERRRRTGKLDAVLRGDFDLIASA